MNAIKPARSDDGKINWQALLKASETSLDKLCTHKGHQNGICVKFASGECLDPKCKRDHPAHWQTPRDWVDATAATLSRGTTKLRKKEDAANGVGSNK